MLEIVQNAIRYRIRGEGPVVQVVTSRFMEGVTLDEDWVWLRRVDAEGPEIQAAHRDWLVRVMEDRDLRTISGGMRLSHGVVGDWIQEGQPYDIPTVDIEMTRGGPLRLRREDIAELVYALGMMRNEMPPDPAAPTKA